MIEYTPILKTGIPAIITGVAAYLIAVKKTNSSEKKQKAKSDAEVQLQALNIVKGVIDTMKAEFLREIEGLNARIDELISENVKLKKSMADLDAQLVTSGKLSATLQEEITSLQRSLMAYKEENDKLKNQ